MKTKLNFLTSDDKQLVRWLGNWSSP